MVHNMTIFKKTQITDQYGFSAENTPTDALRSIIPTRLVGSTFVGTTIDTNFWTSTVANGGTNTQASGQITLATNGSANGSAILNTVRTARYVSISANYFRGVFRLPTAGTVNNIRRWGAFLTTDGFFFELNGTTLNIVTRTGSVDTAVAAASWNGATFSMDTSAHTYEVYYTNSKVYFVIDGILRHTATGSTSPLSSILSLQARIENVNSGGSTSNVLMECRTSAISRLGPLETNNTFFHGTTAATTVLKYGAGMLHRIVLNNAVGTLITIYDNTAGSGTVIGIINTPATANAITLEYKVSFNVGLTIVSTGTWDFTVIYE